MTKINECLSRLVSNAQYIRYRNIEPLNIEWCLTWWTIWCALMFTIFKCAPRKKKWAALPLVNTYFSLAPLPEFPGQKLRKCVGKLHLLVIWNFTQSHYETLTKKLTCIPWWFLTEFYRDFIARILSCH